MSGPALAIVMLHAEVGVNFDIETALMVMSVILAAIQALPSMKNFAMIKPVQVKLLN